MKKWLTPVHLLLIVLLGMCTYANTLHAPFVLDDLESIVNNQTIRNLGNFLPGGTGLDFHFRRCVAYFTFALNYHFGALNVTGYHSFNLAIHCGSALLVYLLADLLLRTPLLARSRIAPNSASLALLAALFFVSHPLQTQAITYVVQRLTSLCTFFYLLSLLLYLAARLRLTASRLQRISQEILSNRRALLLLSASTVAALLAMFTKEIAFTLPLAALLLDLTCFPGPWRQRLPVLLPLLLTLPIIPLLVAVGGEVSTTGALVQSRVDIPRLHYLITQLPVLVTYLRLFVWPVGQNLDYDYPILTSLSEPAALGSLGLLLGLAALAIWLYRKTQTEAGRIDPAWRLIAFGIAWFFLTIAVESSVVPLPDVIFEHRLYLPLAGLALSMAAVVVLLSARSAALLGGRLPLLVAVTAILALAVATWQRNQVWRSEISLWADSAGKSPLKARPLYNYGYYLTEAGRMEEAVAVLTRTVALDPQHADAWHNLGRADLLLGRNEAALSALRTAVRLAPTMDNAVLNLSSALLRTGKPAEALPLLIAVRDRSPAWPEVRFGLGLAWIGVGDLAAAEAELAALQRLNSPLAANLAAIIARASARRTR